MGNINCDMEEIASLEIKLAIRHITKRLEDIEAHLACLPKVDKDALRIAKENKVKP